MSTTTPIDIGDLRGQFGDEAVTAPDDPGYDAARAVFYGGYDRRPVAIVRPRDAEQVAQVIAIARATGLPLSVRSGGHSTGGLSVADGGLTLDLADMRDLEVDPQQRLATAQTGLTAGEVTAAAGEHGLAVGFGDTGSVGIGGITTGGGVGYLSRRYGLTIDNVVAAEVVTADGSVHRVDADTEPDLFWAIRGGGGNIGVATRFTYRLREVPGVVGGMLMQQATAEVISGIIEATADAPEELSVIVNVMTAPPMPMIPEHVHGSVVVMTLVCYSGPEDQADAVLGRLRALGTPLVDTIAPIPYAGMFPPEERGGGDFRPTFASRTLFADALGSDSSEAIVEQLAASSAPMRAVQIRPLGGAIDAVPQDATAYAHRGRRFMINVATMVEAPAAAAERQEWTENLAGLLASGEPGAYVNFLSDDGADRIREAYPHGAYDRLAALKAQYDPANLFRLNQNVAPRG